MSAPFTPENRHHLLLTEAHQLNEFLDARLVGAEVPEDQRLTLACDVLELALAARRAPSVSDGLNAVAASPFKPSIKGERERQLVRRVGRSGYVSVPTRG